jgi:hypothetical protein
MLILQACNIVLPNLQNSRFLFFLFPETKIYELSLSHSERNTHVRSKINRDLWYCLYMQSWTSYTNIKYIMAYLNDFDSNRKNLTDVLTNGGLWEIYIITKFTNQPIYSGLRFYINKYHEIKFSY